MGLSTHEATPRPDWGFYQTDWEVGATSFFKYFVQLQLCWIWLLSRLGEALEHVDQLGNLQPRLERRHERPCYSTSTYGAALIVLSCAVHVIDLLYLFPVLLLLF